MKAIVTSVTGTKYIGDIDIEPGEYTDPDVPIHEAIAEDFPKVLLMKNVRHLFERFLQTPQGDLARNLMLMPVDISSGALDSLVVRVAEIHIPDGEMLDTINGLVKGAEQSEMTSQALKSGLHIPNMKAPSVQ